ncbi:MAG: AraC family transcriptional regulator [Mucilaginibacter sp.]
MADFRFIPITPHPQLSAHVAKIHVFESSGHLDSQERKLIVPNANFKLTLTYRNGMVADIGNKTFIQPENKLSLTGIIDSPVMLDTFNAEPTGTIIIELNPQGAYRFFHLLYAEVKNQIMQLEDLIGNAAAELQLRLGETTSVDLKVQLLQNFLIKQLEKTAPDPIYDYCINRILSTDGILTVAQLEKETGYSARWLHRKFSEHLGTGAKNLSEIIRFKQIYYAYSAGVNFQNLKNHIYHNYHDQSHFLRAFKRFTGHTPTDLQNSTNELSTKHYRT